MISYCVFLRLVPMVEFRCTERRPRGVSGWIVLLLAVQLALLAGCETTGRAVEATGAGTRRMIGGVDPTGLVAETEARKEAWVAVKERAEELNIEGFNASVTALGEAVEQLRVRIEALPPEVLAETQAELTSAAQAFRKQLEGAPTPEGEQATLAEAISTLNAQLARLDVEGINGVIQRTADAAGRLEETISLLRTESEAAIKQATELVREATVTVRNLPVEPVRATAARVERTSADVEQIAGGLAAAPQQVETALASLNAGVRVATVTLVLISTCAVVWLVQALRGRRSG